VYLIIFRLLNIYLPKKWFKLCAKGFHVSDNLKHFLFGYEEILNSNAEEIKDKVRIYDLDEKMIEHIIPQKCCENSEYDVIGNLIKK